jgi:hypothetical protein
MLKTDLTLECIPGLILLYGAKQQSQISPDRSPGPRRRNEYRYHSALRKNRRSATRLSHRIGLPTLSSKRSRESACSTRGPSHWIHAGRARRGPESSGCRWCTLPPRLPNAEEKLVGIRRDIEGLRQTERSLKKVLRDWERRIQQAGPSGKSHLLYSLARVLKQSYTPTNKFRRRRTS